ncbi:MAG TPA: aminoacyl-tRNA hydrolase [Candidatus Omnitrophota bacterium]|nr:aminoacyl-tRNA hydrolase [Candidatus Omnitrophota bacterium]HPD84310.1 aminoacyl-tRNA hydrolase [Candidatus Omnitrophota bacterium]HRZ03167.1 aminoacyl-tRNA hydrolase [Candidatus Omnitrophota bacterium]
MSEFRLIVGLGNPGKDYQHTRHNLGFLVAEHLAKRYKLKWTRSLTVRGLVAHGVIEQNKIYLLLPSTYMNHSGIAVRQMAGRKKIALENILVICDDLNLEFGQMRLKPKGSDGGHHGLHSIVEHIKSNEFTRLRLGIGQPADREEVVNFVLSPFSQAEKKNLVDFVARAADCVVAWILTGTEKTMGQFNKRKVNE